MAGESNAQLTNAFQFQGIDWRGIRHRSVDFGPELTRNNPTFVFGMMHSCVLAAWFIVDRADPSWSLD